ncbi:MAG: Phosphate-specific transport system accessory protein PhoU [Verrucomicrobiota bacterium]|jgi:phosphate transport system protein
MHTEPSRPHTLTNFTASLDHLRGSVLMMSSLTQRNLKNSIRGLMDRDDDWCNNSIADDEEIDLLEMQIDREGIDVMSRFQPVASDLREVISSIKIGANIERVADQAVNIARRARKINEHPEVPELHFLDELVKMAVSMFDDAVRSFAERNAHLAVELKARDKELDRLNRELTDKMIQRMQDDSANLPTYLNLIFVSRCLERIGDHAANMAEDVVFAVRAEDIRHLGK